MPNKSYVPQDLSELMAYLSHMMLASPTFRDNTGYLPRENIDTTFFSLNEGLRAVRKALGEERYAALKDLSDRMRALFEADPDDTAGDTHNGRILINEMKDILKSAAKTPDGKSSVTGKIH
jgi:hypothetical protein